MRRSVFVSGYRVDGNWSWNANDEMEAVMMTTMDDATMMMMRMVMVERDKDEVRR